MATLVPTRLLLLQRFCNLLKEPMTINGGVYDVAVYRSRNILGQDVVENLPALGIIESPRPDIAFFAGDNEARTDKLTLLITGLIDDDDSMERGDMAYWLDAAVQERLSWVSAMKRNGNPEYPEHYMLGELITDLAIAPPVVRPEGDKLSSKASLFLPVRVGIAGLLEQPYTSVP